MLKASFVLLSAANIWLLVCLVRGLIASGRKRFHLDALEVLFTAGLSVVILISWLGLLLAELGILFLPVLTLLLLLTGLGIGWLLLRRGFSLRPASLGRFDQYQILALLLLGAIGFTYARPAEWVTGGADPGSYINIGVHLARTGSLLIRDEALEEVEVDQRDLFVDVQPNNPARDADRFPAFYIRDLDKAVITPQFFHIFPVWIALLFDLGGLSLALYATPFFAALSCLAVYLLGKRLSHPVVGLIAAALLGLNISQLWFARNPFADVVLQFFLFSGFWTMALFGELLELHHPAVNAAAVLSGACLGVSHLVKLDVFIVPPVVVTLLLYLWLFRRLRRAHIYFVSVYLLLMGHASVHAYLFAWPYVFDVFRFFSQYLVFGIYLLLAGLPLLLLVLWQRDWIALRIEQIFRRRAWLERTFVTLVLLLSFYGYFVRPVRADLGAMSDAEISARGEMVEALRFLAREPQIVRLPQEVRSYIEEGMVRVGWFITPLGLWFGIAGFLYWSVTRLTLRSWPFLGAAFISGLMFFYRGAIIPHFFWAFKRYIPVVVPSLMLFIAFLTGQLWLWGRQRWSQRILPVVVVGFLLLSYAQGSALFWPHVEYQGSIQDISALARILPEDGIYLFARSDLSNRLGVPLTFVHERKVFTVAAESQEDARLRAQVTTWINEGQRIFWWSPTCDPLPGYHPQWLRNRFFISWPEVPHLLDRLPREVRAFSSDLCVYEILDTKVKETVPNNHMINFGHQVTLLGAELATERVSPGGEVFLNLYWRAQQLLDENYKVFVHVLDGDMHIVGQKDHIPDTDRRPTHSWAEGEVVVDSVVVPLSSDAAPGHCQVQIGLYTEATMRRLAVVGNDGVEGDGVTLGAVEVIALGEQK